MLQPLQLEDVSVRYAAEIAELREFLLKAGLPIGTGDSLRSMVTRLRDRAFHRDLTSHLWVVMDRWERQIRYSDLLGVLAIAAAGTDCAAAAEEGDAHALLRLLMEARRSLDAMWPEKDGAFADHPATPTAIASAGSLQVARDDRQEIFSRPLRTIETESSFVEMPRETSGVRRRLAWVAAACVLAALPVGLWLHHGKVGDTATVFMAPTITGSVPRAALAEGGEASSSLRDGEATAMAHPYSKNAHNSPRRMPFSPTARTFRATPDASSMPPAPMPSRIPPASADGLAHPHTIADVPPAAGTRNPASPASLSSARDASASSAAAIAVPASRLSRRLGSPTLPMYASVQNGEFTADGHRYPRLLRRQTKASSGTSSTKEANLIASADPAEMPPMPSTGGMAPANAARGGIVRPTSVGIMAGNVLYSPSPAYPAAASAAHVQGEVKVQAEVDRSGNVAAARVVSGPPLLRDAALDAVQRWRYRPYLLSGKPIPMSAVAVVDFELP